MAGTTRANKAYWADACLKVPEDASYLVLVMGEVHDFFKPVDGATWCSMLAANNKHQWSPNGLVWRIPAYDTSPSYPRSGGSVANWPKMNIAGDGRKHLSSWGHCYGDGGCCSTSYVDEDEGWNQPFTLGYGVLFHVAQPPPLDTTITVFATVAATTKANNDYWNEKCKEIPDDATYLMLDIGEVRDFFKPTDGATMCHMLVSNTKHQWSPNGLDWRIPAYYAGHYTDTDDHGHKGGSATD
jgi:hypothetical protein